MLSDLENSDSDLEDIESRLYSQVFHSHLDESEQNISELTMEHNNGEAQDDSNLGDLRSHLNTLKHKKNTRYFKPPSNYSGGQVHNNIFGGHIVPTGNPVIRNQTTSNHQNGFPQFFPLNIPEQNFFIILPTVPLSNVPLAPATSTQMQAHTPRFPPVPKLTKSQRRKLNKEKRKNELALIKAATKDAEVFKNLSITDRKKVLHYQKLERIRLKKKERKKQEDEQKLMHKYNEYIDRKLAENNGTQQNLLEVTNNDINSMQELAEHNAPEVKITNDGDDSPNSEVIFVPTVPQIISISESDSDDCEIVGNTNIPLNLNCGAEVDVKEVTMLYDINGLGCDAQDSKVNVLENCNDDDVVFIEPEPVQENIIDLDSEPETNARNSSDIETASHSSITQELRPPISTPTKQGISLRNQRELTSTPESFNDFLENSIDSRQNFSNSSDINAKDTSKAKTFNEVCGSESSAASDLSLSTRNNVFNEVEFETPSKELFSDGNLQTFSDFITPKRLVANGEKETVGVERSESSVSSESEHEGESTKKKKKRRRLPSLSHIEPQEVSPMTDLTKSASKKKKKKKAKIDNEIDTQVNDTIADQIDAENTVNESPVKRKKKKKNKSEPMENSELEQSKENLEETLSSANSTGETTKQKKKRASINEDSLEVAEPLNLEDTVGENVDCDTPSKMKKRKKKKWKIDSTTQNEIDVDENAMEKNAESVVDAENDQLLSDGPTLGKKLKKKKHSETQCASDEINENANDETIVEDESIAENALNESCSEVSRRKSKKKKKCKKSQKDLETEADENVGELKEVENNKIDEIKQPQVDEPCESPARKRKKKKKNERDSKNEHEQLDICNSESIEPGRDCISSIGVDEDNNMSKGTPNDSVVIVEQCNDDHSSSDIELIEAVPDFVVIDDDDDEEIIDSCNKDTIREDFDTNIKKPSEESTTTKQSSPVKTDSRRFASLWSEDPATFYKNLYEDSKKFDMNEARRNMSNNSEKWKILPSDKYKFRTSRPRCKRCREMGHSFKFCRKPPLLICKLCSGHGHMASNCPNALCTQCGSRTMLTSTWCQKCSYLRYEYCSICGELGHTNFYCPDTWRRYHLTTEEGPIVRPTEEPSLRPARDQWCSGCARKGHFEYTCRYFNREHGPTLPGIVDYKDLYGFRLNSNNNANQRLDDKHNASCIEVPDIANYNERNDLHREVTPSTRNLWKETVKCSSNLIIEIFKPYFSCFARRLQIDDTIEIHIDNSLMAQARLDIIGPKHKVRTIKNLIYQYKPNKLKHYNCTRLNAEISKCMSLIGTISDDPMQLLNKLKPLLDVPGHQEFIRLNVVLFGQLQLQEGALHLQFLKAYLKTAQKYAHLTPANYRAVIMSHRYIFKSKRSYEEYLGIVEDGKRNNPLLWQAK